MLLRILGSAAGGGFPQWNCNCPRCRGVRTGTLQARSRTQSSLAVRGSNGAWALVNASPDVLQQLHAHADLHPARGTRDAAIRAIVLMDGQIDHTTGLLMLREAAQPWPVWCTEAVHAELTNEWPLLDVLGHYCGVQHHAIATATDFAVDGIEHVRWRALELQSKAPPYSRDRVVPTRASNIALTIANVQTQRTALYAPGLGHVTSDLWEHMQRADLVLIDGTCWHDDELERLGISRKTARDMGHLPLSGPGGTIEWLQRLPASTRKVLTHINNTNPILDERSTERAQLAALGIEVACDGMEFEL
jgi:pyrroloquinoline quinone biosynthesis protein B